MPKNLSKIPEILQDYFTVTEAAKALKVTRGAIYKAIRLDHLQAYRHGKRFYLKKQDVIRYGKERHKRQ